MISSLNSTAIRSAYQSSETSPKTEKKSLENQGDTSKIGALKSAIENGEYKVNIEQLSGKIADELL